MVNVGQSVSRRKNDVTRERPWKQKETVWKVYAISHLVIYQFFLPWIASLVNCHCLALPTIDIASWWLIGSMFEQRAAKKIEKMMIPTGKKRKKKVLALCFC